MQKVRIVSLDKDKPKVVAALHMMGALDLRKSKLDLGDDRPAAYSTDISDSLIKVNGALAFLSKRDVRSERQMDVKHLVAQVRKLAVLDEIYSLGAEKKTLEEDLRSLGYAQHIAEAFLDMGIDFSKLRSDHVLYKALETDGKGAKLFAKRSKSIKDADIQVRKSGKSVLILIVYPKAAAIDELLKGIKINELDLFAKYLDGTPQAILKSVRKKKAYDIARLALIAKKFESVSSGYYSQLVNLKEMLEIQLQRSEVSGMFKRTEKVVVIEGWVQKRQADELRKGISSVTHGRIQFEEIDGDELAPTHTRRPKFLQPFDYLVSFYSIQRSDEIDPTWIFILSLPIFYGLMISDVGYGIASLLLATFIAKKTDPEGLMYNAAKIWQLNSFAAMFFGFISNQWFGFALPYSTPISFNWLTNTPELIAITVLFGVAQVILGLALGVVNSYHHGHRKMAYARTFSILVVFFGTIAVAGAFFGAFNGAITEVSGIIAVASVLLTVILSGSEATETLNLITHPMSYARLMGFGLGSVIIAFLIDMAFTPHLSAGIPIFILYAILFIALHFLNMTLSIFEGIVQGVRLNFVEFFSKFYIGNGVLFKPFSYKRVHTKE